MSLPLLRTTSLMERQSHGILSIVIKLRRDFVQASGSGGEEAKNSLKHLISL
jgi:hypothetical protein